MPIQSTKSLAVILLTAFTGCHGEAPLVVPSQSPRTAVSEALPSWKDGPAKASIITFVTKVTEPEGPDFVPPAERIAVFDNDGTLWSEQPAYVQLLFALDRVREVAPMHPEWDDESPFAAALEGDIDGLLGGGTKAVAEIVMASHAGSTTDEFAEVVASWMRQARHPTLHRPFTSLVYQPMLELLGYLRANHFKTYIVSGGGIEFTRAWAPAVYGIPPEQIIGSSVTTRYELRGRVPVLFRLPEIDFIDDGPGKPVGINRFIGRRPIFAFGNSDGDLQMLQWTTAGSGPRFAGLVHHTDADREWGYDRQSLVGRLDKALDEAPERGWTVVDMKADWNTVYSQRNKP